MARVVGIDHLVIRVSDAAKSKDFYNNVLGFLGFKLKYEYGDHAGWSNGKTLLWIGEADAEGKKHPHRIGNIGFHHYAFELSKRKDVDDLYAFLKRNGVTVVDPPADYPEYGEGYYAVFFLDPDGLKLEGMVFEPPKKKPPKKKTKK
jgi:catechol 2,3-dioxygenase-like lactoylglutathione lyase family enzyme